MMVVVCDDEPKRGVEVVQAIKDVAPYIDVEPLLGEDLTKVLKSSLSRGVKDYLNDPSSSIDIAGPPPFASADLAIFDNNLAQLEIEGVLLTAESIVGFVRGFTAVPYIVSLNKNPNVDFDLRFLIGDYQTRADIALNADHLENPALWTGNPGEATGGFLPWYWPSLSTVADRRRQQIAFVRDCLSQSILDALEFPTDPDSLGFLSRHAVGALAPDLEPEGTPDEESIPIQRVSFQRYFQARNRSFPDVRDRKRLIEKANGDDPIAREIIARVVAADIDHWLRRDVLGPQELLIDVPHLLMRMPFLLADRAAETDEWNKAVTTREPRFGMDGSLFNSHLEGKRFKYDMWMDKPAFWWPEIRRDEALAEMLYNAARGTWADVVFCEDRSAFLPRHSDSTDRQPREFLAEFEGSWGRRYVTKIPGISYQPGIRFAY
jgi:hypothetical protein